MRRPILAGAASAWLALAPAAALAGGSNLLIPSAIGGSVGVAAAPSTSPAFHAIVENGCVSGPDCGVSVSFGTAPAVGDWLIAVNVAGSSTEEAGWTNVDIVPDCNPSGGNPLRVAYHQVQTGDGATFTPFSNTGSSGMGVAVADLTALGSSWSGIVHGFASGCAVGNNVTIVSDTLPPNGVVFGVVFDTAVGIGGTPSMATITGLGLANVYSVSGPSSTGIGVAAAYGIPSATAYASVSVTTTTSMTGSYPQTSGVLVELNPS